MKHKIAFSIILILMMFIGFVHFTDEALAADDPDLYKIKVNRQENVVTVYRNEGGDYVPYRAMVCSAGGEGYTTPLMTSGIDQKFRWCYLFGDVWGQYCTQIDGDYLFHSVYYKEKGQKDTLVIKEYNKLGKGCSKGCIRLSVIDAKWIYDNCCKDTEVTIYDSDNPGPLGKPVPQRLSSDAKWDPTDPDEDNPEFYIPAPVLKFNGKKQKVTYGEPYDLLEDVTAINPNTFQDLTSSIEIDAVRKWNGEKWEDVKFSSKNVGKYNITYKVYDEYCGDPTYETLSVKVSDNDAPTLKVPDTVTVSPGHKDLLCKVSAKQKSRDRIGAIKVNVLEPNGNFVELNYAQAREFVFDKVGDYFVTYTVSNYYDESKIDTELCIIRCRDEFQQNFDKWIN